jgi:hypothetical protein
MFFVLFEPDHASGVGLVGFVVDLHEHARQSGTLGEMCVADHVWSVGMIPLAALDGVYGDVALSGERCRAEYREQ